MKKRIQDFKKYLDSRGVPIEEFVKLVIVFGILLCATSVLVYGAICALLI